MWMEAMNATTVRLAAIFLILGGCAVGEPVTKPEPAPPPVEKAPEPPPPPRVEVEKPKPEPPPPAKPAAKPEVKRTQLQLGIEAYDDGRHQEAAKLLRATLASDPSSADQVQAYKYLAFIECSANRRTQCRENFRRALAIDPTLELTAAESGHPVWGPIFRGLKQPKKPKR
jgi:type IV secretory pathway VirB10-like protein